VIVIVAGMQRSGSTFSYNVVRELLDARGGVSTSSSNSINDVLSESDGPINAIVKSHSPDALINALLNKRGIPCVCTVRKPEDAIASWMNVFGFSLEDSVATYEQWLSWHQKMHKNMLNIKYEDIDRYPWLAIRKISKYLFGKWDAFEVQKIWLNNKKKTVYKKTSRMEVSDSVDIGFSFYNKVNFYHRRHISSLRSKDASELLSQDQICFIRSNLNRYLDKNGAYQW
jgi:hypothetical protein